ncbi:hypothetical protein LTR97_004891 [Elasticomyces elasticus]|uniref:Uncharacterized protein n=1 Tax=Elasticomyces elasticus TaxID=574655 RepID=A0AAN7ZP72_9PEZI|nr:hypothetical protein LTR97_004891 [Elasticomyces elasticus]
MAFHNEVIIPRYLVQVDTEGIISLLALLGLLAFFQVTFGRLVHPGMDKQREDRMSYGSSAAA